MTEHIFPYDDRGTDVSGPCRGMGTCGALLQFLGIASMSRGNPSLALDYYMNGLKDSDTYDLPMQKIMILINMGLLYLECGHYADSENSF